MEDVEGIVVQTQMKVEKTEFDNLKNEKRIENAEKRINDVEAVGLRALHTENRVLDAQVRPIGHTVKAIGWYGKFGLVFNLRIFLCR